MRFEERTLRKLELRGKGMDGACRAGRFWGRSFALGFVMIVPSAYFALIAEFFREGEYPWNLVHWGLRAIAVGFVTWTVWVWLQQRATSPRRALKLFYFHAALAQFKKAQSLVLPTDMDDHPRPETEFGGLILDDPELRVFAKEGDFEAYWKRIFPVRFYHSSSVAICRFRLQEIAPDLVLAGFRLKRIRTNIPLSFLAAALQVDFVDSTTESFKLQKLLVRVDDEWKLVDGALMSNEERALSRSNE